MGAGANAELIRRLAARQPDLLRVGAAFADVSVDEVESCEVLGVDQLGFDLRTVTLDGAQDGEVGPHLRPTPAHHLLTCSPAPCYMDTYVSCTCTYTCTG